MAELRTEDGIDTADPGRERPAQDAADLPAGAVLAGKYRVERTLGAGGMGVVVAATRIEDGEQVAIKVLRTEALKNKDVVARFEREARAVAKLGGEHVVRIVDIGTLDGGEQYIAMEYLDGEDLARLLKERGPLPIAEAVDYLAQACEALAEVHAAGIVHRDLKPGNLFLTRDADGAPRIKLLDFGIAKTGPGSAGEGEVTLTTTESFLGSPVYMSPEQMVTPKKVDGRTDVWALGVTLYRLLSRRVPFQGETPMEICGMIMSGTRPTSLRDVRADVPDELDRAVSKCLAREAADRHRNVAELAAAIAPFGTPAAAASAARTRERLAGVESAWATLPGPLLPPVQPPRVVADDAETLAAGTLSSLDPTRAPSAGVSPRTFVIAAVGAAILAGGFWMFRSSLAGTAAPTGEPSAPTSARQATAADQPLAAIPTGAPVASATAATTAEPVGSAAAAVSASSVPAATAAPKAAGKRDAKSKPDASAAPVVSAPPTSSALPGGVYGGRPF